MCCKNVNLVKLRRFTGAVVAREYGLPCVIGVQNATKTFKTGDKVHLSGKIGTVGLVNE